jgi:MoaA/NifB/PqqE/SkfB family radical SAM enzyme
LAVYYLTYACRFRCPYCSDGNGTPYPELRERILDATSAVKLLSHVRKYSDYLVLTGGEPLQHPELAEVLSGVGRLGFDGVILTTNGDGLDRVAAEVNESVHHLVFSLDTLDAARADACFGVGPGALGRILSQIDTAAKLPRRRYDIVISSVVTPTGIADLYAVYEYCKERRYLFAACPQLLGKVAHPDLSQSDDYRRFFEYLIREKKNGARVNGTVEYLEHMRDLRKFDCVPSSVLSVSPSGNVFYPCLEIANVAGNLLEEPDLNRLRRRASQEFGPEPRCGTQCHSACALSFSLLLNQPWIGLREGYLQLLSG